jgi:hypothetical protein
MRRPLDHRLRLKVIRVTFLNGSHNRATAEGNNAAWACSCGSQLVGRCYFQFGDTCHTRCECGRQFRVVGDGQKRAVAVVEETAAQPLLGGIA